MKTRLLVLLVVAAVSVATPQGMPAVTSPEAAALLAHTRTPAMLPARDFDPEREVTIPAGTLMRLRLENRVGSDISSVEDPVRARLVNPIVVDGRTVLPSESVVLGSVTQARRSGKVKGRAQLGMRFHTITPRGDDERYRISTRPWIRTAPGTKKKDAAKIAVPAAGGAIVGGVIGGKKGAAIGAGAGGGAGTAVVLSTRGEEVRRGRGAIVLVRLSAPLTVQLR